MNERKIIANLISYLLSHDAYAYQVIDKIKNQLYSAGWDENEIKLALESIYKECD